MGSGPWRAVDEFRAGALLPCDAILDAVVAASTEVAGSGPILPALPDLVAEPRTTGRDIGHFVAPCGLAIVTAFLATDPERPRQFVALVVTGEIAPLLKRDAASWHDGIHWRT